ncbi:MAG: ankyrin repeat domain-containing protein [Pirellulales bacterium]|nr:ankyrin repeat domain-containing protein [Pirellulales bacterium]
MAKKKTPESELFFARFDDDLTALRKLLDAGEDVNARDREGSTVLIYAAGFGQTAFVSELIARGADVNAQDEEGYTALHAAAAHHCLEIVELLLKHGANVDACDQHGNTPLSKAVYFQSPDRNRDAVIKCLIAHGADQTRKNKYGVSPIDLIAGSGNIESEPTSMPKASPTKTEPFMEHPSGEFATTVDAMTDAIKRLRKLKPWDKWITFSASGQGSRPDTYHIVDVLVHGQSVNIGDESVDLDAVLSRAGLSRSKLQDSHEKGIIELRHTTPVQFAKFLDSLFYHFGVRPFEDEDDYAVGVEW